MQKNKDLLNSPQLTSLDVSINPSIIEDSRLLSLLQGYSQVLDENGEPMVVYNGTNSEKSFDPFKHKGSCSQESYMSADIQAFFFDLKSVAEVYEYRCNCSFSLFLLVDGHIIRYKVFKLYFHGW